MTFSSTILGIDVGTSGIRGCLVSYQHSKILTQFEVPMPFPIRDTTKIGHSEQSPKIWLKALETLLFQISAHQLAPTIEHIIVDATSSTVCLMDKHSNFLTTGIMYDDTRAQTEAEQIRQFAPLDSGALGSASTLAKVLRLSKTIPSNQAIIMNQVDVINHALTQSLNQTDMNNALKLGFDVKSETWPSWIKQLTSIQLPKISLPGTPLGVLNPQTQWIDPNCVKNFSPNTQIYFGTTDSIAAFLATGANKIGDGVTSLGSTLAIKLLSPIPLFAPEQGVYSHKLNQKWLVGGASNTGGAILLKYFSLAQIKDFSQKINLQEPTHLNYYPLLKPGERFPIADPNLQPKLTPKPPSEYLFFQGLVEGLVQIETLAYQKIEELSRAPFLRAEKDKNNPSIQLKRLFATGGGVKNKGWMALRQQSIFASHQPSKQTDAAFGVTQLLTKRGH